MFTGNEKQVRAMENGGNAKVNAIFEARLAGSGRKKPTHLADGPTRERFIRDKYERRKFYDPAGYARPGNAGGVPAAPTSGPSARGAPSDIARRRVANRQARMKTAQSQMEAPAPAPPVVTQAPVSAPVDLLDFADFSTQSPAPAPPAAPAHDPFAPVPAAPAADPFAAAQAPVAAPPKLTPPPVTAPIAATPVAPAPTPGQEFLTPAPAAPAPASNASIMALFNPTNQSHNVGFGNQSNVGMPTNNNMMMMGAPMMQQESSAKDDDESKAKSSATTNDDDESESHGTKDEPNKSSRDDDEQYSPIQ